MINGVIKTVIPDRGFGFIRDDGNKDYFFHVRDLPQGERFDSTLVDKPVAFELQDTDRGPRAVNVRVFDNSLPPAA